MEIYAVYNGKQSHFNDEINAQLATGASPIDFISLQVIFDSFPNEFGSDEFEKFTLFNVNLRDIQAMFPFKMVTINHEGEALKYTLFKVILNDFASGQFVSSHKEVGNDTNLFLNAIPQSFALLDKTSYDKFITDGHYTYQTFVCSTSRVPC